MLTGTVVEFEQGKRTGMIEGGDGQKYILEPGSFRRSTRLRLGNIVRFTTWNLYAGPTAKDVELVRASAGPSNLSGAPHLPPKKFVHR